MPTEMSNHIIHQEQPPQEQQPAESNPETSDFFKKISEELARINFILETGYKDEDGDEKLTHKEIQEYSFIKRILEWKIKLMNKKKSGNVTREWDNLFSEEHNASDILSDFCERLNFSPEVDKDNQIVFRIFDNLDTSPFVEIKGTKLTKQGEGEDVAIKKDNQDRLLLQYNAERKKFELIDEIPDGYETQDIHPFGELVILANTQTDNPVDFGYDDYSDPGDYRKDFRLCHIDKFKGQKLQPVIKFSSDDSIAEYFRRKREKISIEEERIYTQLNNICRNMKGDKKQIRKKVMQFIKDEKERMGVDLYKTMIDFRQYSYSLKDKDMRELGVVADEYNCILRDCGQTLHIRGVFFSEDGSSIIRMVQSSRLPGRYAMSLVVIPVTDNFTSTCSLHHEDIGIIPLKCGGTPGNYFEGNDNYYRLPYNFFYKNHTSTRDTDKVNKSLGNFENLKYRWKF